MTERIQPQPVGESRGLFSRLFQPTGNKEQESAARVYRNYRVNYPYLAAVVEQIPADEAKSIADNLAKLRNKPAKRALERLFSIESSDAFADSHVESGYNLDLGKSLDTRGLSDLLGNQGVLDLLPIMWDFVFEKEKGDPYTNDVTHTKMALSLLLGRLPWNKASEKLRQKISDTRTLNYGITYPKDKFLCDAAEEKMERAMSDDYHFTVLVDGTMLTKVAPGKLSAVCLYPVEAYNGILVPGVWYSPMDYSVRQEIREAFDKGRMQVDLETVSQWAIMRPVGPNLESTHGDRPLADYLSNLRRYALNLPANPPMEIYVIQENAIVSRVEARTILAEHL